MSESARRAARESWLACVLPALSDASFDEVHTIVETRLRDDIAARVGGVDPRDVIGDGRATGGRS